MCGQKIAKKLAIVSKIDNGAGYNLPFFAPSSSFFLINKNLGLSGHRGNKTRHANAGIALKAKHTGQRFQVPVEI